MRTWEGYTRIARRLSRGLPWQFRRKTTDTSWRVETGEQERDRIWHSGVQRWGRAVVGEPLRGT
jgi:hypothetical protein